MNILKSLQSLLGLYSVPDQNRVLGIDISHWSGLVDFEKAKAQGVKFVIIKAMDGTTPTKWFPENYAGAKQAGLLVGAYTWLYKTSVISTGRQARAFSDLLKNYPCEIPPTVDFEPSGSGNPTYNDLYGFVTPFEQLTSKKPMIYTGPYYWNQYGKPSNAAWKEYPLWIANYGVSSPMLVQPWDKEYKIWQFTDRLDGTLYGVSGEKMLDGNYFNGTIDEMYSWLGLTNPNPTPLPAPSKTNLYIFSKESYWKRPAGGPLVTPTYNITKTSSKKEILLNSVWVNWIKYMLSNTTKAFEKIVSPGWGPSKGYNDNNLLIYNTLIYPGRNIVEVTETMLGMDGQLWGKLTCIPVNANTGIPNSSINFIDTPHLVHKVYGSGNNFTWFALGADAPKCPILEEDGSKFVEMKWLTPIDSLLPKSVKITAIPALNTRNAPSTNGLVIGRKVNGTTVTVTDVKIGKGGIWGKISDTEWIALRSQDINYTNWII